MNTTKIDLWGIEEIKKDRVTGTAKSVFFIRVDTPIIFLQMNNGTFKKVEQWDHITPKEEEHINFNPKKYLSIDKSIAFAIREMHPLQTESNNFSEKTLIRREVDFTIYRRIKDYNSNYIESIARVNFYKPITTEEFNTIKETLDIPKTIPEGYIKEINLDKFPRNNIILDYKTYIDEKKKTKFSATIEKNSKKLKVEIESPKKNNKIILEKNLTNQDIKDLEAVTSDELTEEVAKKNILNIML